jgi:hypothetical protein
MLGFRAESGMSLEKSTTDVNSQRRWREDHQPLLLCGNEWKMQRPTVFALGLNLNENLLFTHDLDDLSDVGTRLL